MKSEEAVDAVEVAGENLDVQGVGEVGGVDRGGLARGRGGDVHAAAGERVGQHGDYRDEVAR